jgi:hypothetical protein
MKPNFKAMSRKELKAYVLEHRDDSEAISAYIEKSESEGNWVKMPPLKSMKDLDNYPEFLEKIHKDGEGHSEGVSTVVNNNEQQPERVFESDAIKITSNTQQWNEPYGGVFPGKSRVVLRSYNDIGYQIVSEGDGTIFGTFSDLPDQASNLAQAEEWLSASGYRNKIKQLIGQPEGQNLEYKLVVPPPAIIARIIAAFANTNGGVLIFGVRDDLTIKGLADDAPASAMVEASLERINPRPFVKHYFLGVEVGDETKYLYIVEVEKSPVALITEDQNIYIRTGVTIQKAAFPDIVHVSQKQETEFRSQVIQQIEQEGKNATASKLRILEHYRNLFLIANESIDTSGSVEPQLLSGSSHGRTLMRLILSSLVDSFETYLAELLFEIHLAEPKTLISNSQVTVQEVMDCKDMASFIEFVANKRVQELTRGNEEKFANYLKKVTNFDLFLESEVTQAKDFFQRRHLYTHKNGKIDAQFLAKSSSSSLKSGEEHKTSLKELSEAVTLFLGIVSRLDSSVVKKYGLETYDLEA